MKGEEVIPAAPAPPVEPEIGPLVEPPAPVQVGSPRLKAFSDVPLQLSIEIGRLRIPLREIAELKTGKIFRIQKAAGEPFDICANGQALARGEVIVVENSSGLRITEILKL